MIEVSSFGTMPPATPDAGLEVHQIAVTSGPVTLRLVTLGAAVAGLHVPDRLGRPGPVHLELPELVAYADRRRNPFLGSVIGRYANRIAGASFELDGARHHLASGDGPHALHGGPDGWDRRVWQLAEARSTAGGGAVTFSLSSPDGDSGFPGRVDATASYALDGDTLRITCTALTDAPTVINMAHHGYWNLAGTGTGAGTIHDHHLCVAADRVLPVDDTGIPIGPPVTVVETPFDLRTRTRLGDAMAALGAGFDHCFELPRPAGDLRTAAVLDAPSAGRWMSVRTDRPGMQLYTGNGLGEPFAPHAALCLEAQAFPDAPNRPELGDVRLDPGGRHDTVTELRFGVGPPPVDDLGRS